MKVKLISDFRDYYDHYFCGSYDIPDKIWTRNSVDNNWSKREQLKLLDSFNLLTPLHRVVKDLATNIHFTEDFYIVYLDEYSHEGLTRKKVGEPYYNEYSSWNTDPQTEGSPTFSGTMRHRGEGKTLLSRADALNIYPDHYCSLYIKPEHNYSVSYRLLHIGAEKFWLKYQSSDWRSNYGEDVKIETVDNNLNHSKYYDKLRLQEKLYPYPLFAIDFIESKHNTLLAIDFNTAPGLKNSPVTEIISAYSVYKKIENWIEMFPLLFNTLN